MSDPKHDEIKRRLEAAGFDTATAAPLIPLLAPALRAEPMPAPDVDEGEPLMRYADAARFLNMPLGSLYNAVAAEKIPCLRIGPKSIRFDRRELAAWIRARSGRNG